MKLKSCLLLALAILLLISACTVNRPICATSNPLGQKVGIYSQQSLFGFPPIANKDAAIAKAAYNGGITKISTVDYNTTWMLFVVKYETIVTGD